MKCLTIDISILGKEIIEYFVRELESEGITQVPQWTEPEDTARRQSNNIEDSQNSNDLVLGASASNLSNGKSLSSPIKKGEIY